LREKSKRREIRLKKIGSGAYCSIEWLCGMVSVHERQPGIKIGEVADTSKSIVREKA